MKIIKYSSFIFLLLILGIGYFSYTMNEMYIYDENMYVASGVLIQNHKLYSDFSYYQMPYQPLIFGLVYKLTGSSFYYMIGRIIQCFSILISIFFIFLITRKMTKDFLVSIFTMIIFSFNGIIVWTSSYINNSAIPMVFSLVGLYLFLLYSYDEKGINEKHNTLGLLFCGISLAAATGVKVYYATVMLPVLLTAILFPLELNPNIKFKKQVLPITLGFFIGLIPVFYYAISDFDTFMFNNFEYHTLNTIWRRFTYNENTGSFNSKMNFFIYLITFKSIVVVLISYLALLIFAVIAYFKKKFDYGILLGKKENFLLITLSIFSTFAALAPDPLWNHYLALPIPFVVLLIGSLTNSFTGKLKTVLILVFTVLSLASVYNGNIRLFGYTKEITKPKEWLPVKFHKFAVSEGQALKEKGLKGKIATYHPIFALEGGYDIYPEYSSTIFSIRVGVFLSEKEREKYKITSLKTFSKPFEKEPPVAFYIGGIRKFDDQFLKYTISKGYRLDQRYSYIDTYFISKNH